MHMPDPVAFHIGSLAIYWYGICVAAGFMAGYAYLLKRGRKMGIAEEASSDLVFYAACSGLFGARLLYVVTFWNQEFSGQNPVLAFLRIRDGGLIYYGGFVAAALALLLLCRRKKLPLPVVADLLAVGLPIGHAFGRLGCFLRGCCHGAHYEGPGAVCYPVDGPVGAYSEPYFPIQLMGSLGNLALAGLLFWLSLRIKQPGWLFPLYLVLFGTCRFLAEFSRGDYTAANTLASLTQAQVVCLTVVIPLGVGLLVWMAATRPGKEAR